MGERNVFHEDCVGEDEDPKNRSQCEGRQSVKDIIAQKIMDLKRKVFGLQELQKMLGDKPSVEMEQMIYDILQGRFNRF